MRKQHAFQFVNKFDFIYTAILKDQNHVLNSFKKSNNNNNNVTSEKPKKNYYKLQMYIVKKIIILMNKDKLTLKIASSYAL